MVGDDWIDVEAIMEQLIPMVAPGKAKRRYQSRLKSARERNGQVHVESPLSEDEQILSGARSIVNERILSNVSRGRFELLNEDGHRRLRLRPVTADEGNGVCKECLRPFPNAATTRKTSTSKPRTKSKVIYVTFPQWGDRNVGETSDG